MGNWLDLARDSRNAASRLIVDRHSRSAISRAYYAVYSKVTHELLQNGVLMPKDREGPSHAKLRALVESNFYHMPREKREALSRMIGFLYAMRVMADYSPEALVDDRDSREAASMMKKSFDSF